MFTIHIRREITSSKYAPLLNILTWYNNYFCKVGTSNYWSFICIPMGVHQQAKLKEAVQVVHGNVHYVRSGVVPADQKVNIHILLIDRQISSTLQSPFPYSKKGIYSDLPLSKSQMQKGINMQYTYIDCIFKICKYLYYILQIVQLLSLLQVVL